MSRSHSMITWMFVVWFLSACSAFAEDKPSDKKDLPEKPSVGQPPSAVSNDPSQPGAAVPHGPKDSPIRAGEAAIEKALDEPTQMEFKDAPLRDVIDYLKDKHRIEIQLDNKALGDVGIGSDTPVTRNLKGVSLRSTLNLLLRDLSLTWIIKDDVLLITTLEEAESQATTKVYDVSDLVVCDNKDDEPWDDYDTLISAITDVVRPTTWDVVGGPGSIAGASLGTAKVLMVSQTYEVHGEIANFLAEIRNIAAKNPDEELPRRDKPITHPKPEMPKAIGDPFIRDGSPIAKPSKPGAVPPAAEQQKESK